MAIKLTLRNRTVDDTIFIPRQLAKNLLAQPDPGRALVDLFQRLPEDRTTVHDSEHLKAIALWAPGAEDGRPAGLTTMEAARWFGLINRISTLKPIDGGILTLNDLQYKLIYDRLMDPRFRILQQTPQLAAFVTDFVAAGGMHIADVSDLLYENLDEA